MPMYQKAKPFDFVRDFKDLKDQVKGLQVVSPGQNGQWTDESASVPAGFTVATVLRYRYYAADNTVRIQFSLNSTASGATYTLFTLPSQYFPAVQYNGCAPTIHNTLGAYASSVVNSGFVVTTAGVVQLLFPGSITLVSGHYVVPLD